MNASRVIVIDHRDSFVHLLAEQFAQLGADIETWRASLSLSALRQRLEAYSPDLVVLSPGPGHPKDAGVTPQWLATRPKRPVLGVCLGHQAMALAEGAEVIRAPQPVHGRAWSIDLQNDPLFEGLPQKMTVARYHSLVLASPPAAFRVVATAREGDATLVMAMRHRSLPWIGLQFHPESILTPYGRLLQQRILDEAKEHNLAGDQHLDQPGQPER